MAVTNVLEDFVERKSLEKSSHQPSDFARGQCIPTGEIVPLSWDEKEETAIRRRLDLTVVPVVTFLYLLCFIDRVEVPSNILMKRYGPHIITDISQVPTLVIGFGFVSICTAFVKSFAGLANARAVLGIFEGGTMPGITFFLSCFYKRNELFVHVGVFVAASALAGAFGGLLASALMTRAHLYTWSDDGSEDTEGAPSHDG
ncbi:major facilitator superfamily transporter [Fusarium phyllophilum]|uniref:Major facilitator superfamily transporter n=1 Tax=Fusarium phyllophilum TaxID=47803 RepID=A0A8H5I3K2_9HYPO|nr:major facilitator superfamily transporter [Fusarium phyllophilum]